MKRRLLFVVAMALCWLVAGQQGRNQAAADARAPKADASFVHAVIFTLKKDAPADAANALVKDVHDMLAKIPSVRSAKAGPPAKKAKPDVAKTDFSIGLLVLLDDLDGLTAYLEHPLHLKFVEKHGKNLDFDKLVVYDYVDQK
jgi:hypothetical protein